MTIPMARIAGRLFDTPLLVDAGKAAAIAAAIGPRVLGLPVTVAGAEPVDHVAFASSMGRVGDPLGLRYERAGQGQALLPVINGVGIIAIEGTLVHKGRWVGSYSGETSYEGVQAQAQRARRDPNVRGVVLEIDTFGGEAAGAFDTANILAQLSAEKPTLAILTDHALSAGYLLACSARQIVAPETGRAGSIGVITMHADFSRQLDTMGVTVTLLHSGAHKADLNPFEALPEEVAKRVTAELDQARDAFAAAVGKGRGKRFTKAQALATEALVYRAEEALRLGLIDAVGHPSDAFDAFAAAVNRPGTGLI